MSDDDIRVSLGHVQVGLGRIEEKVDGLRSENRKADELHADHEQRIRRLERWMYSLTALAAAGGSAVGSILPRLLQ